MGFTKTQAVERAEVLSPDQHTRIEDELHRLGKKTAKDLTDAERRAVLQPE